MSLYRVKQFYWSITSEIDLEDEKIINKFLNESEKEKFHKLSTYEKKHSVKVAREVLERCKDINSSGEMFIKAALLHDIGKIYSSLNPIEKSLVVMLNNLTKGKLRKYKNIKKIDVYYNHGDMGYELLKSIGNYDERFLYLIKNHHNDFIIGDKELSLLKECDSNN